MSDWPLRKLGDPEVCVLNPKKPEAADIADNALVSFVPMAKIDDVTGTMDASDSRKICDVRKGYTYFSEGDVVFAKITPCMENGKSAIARNLINRIGFGTTEFQVLRPGPSAIAEWIHLLVRNKAFREEAKKNMHGAAGQQRVPVDFLREVTIPIPPLNEQRRVVLRVQELTCRAEEARNLLAERESDLNTLLQSLYNKLTSGVEWKPLRDVASLVRRAVKTEPDRQYEEMGIRSFGKGTFKSQY
jgi:type I restriction enzyme S subunit